MDELNVKLLSPSEPLFEGKVKRIQVPGHSGQLGVFPGHTAMITQLGMGHLELHLDGGTVSDFFVSGGYLQVDNNEVNVLVDVVEEATSIDIDRASEAANRAIKLLNDRDNLDIDIGRALASLRRAKARQSLVDKSKTRKR